MRKKNDRGVCTCKPPTTNSRICMICGGWAHVYCPPASKVPLTALDTSEGGGTVQVDLTEHLLRDVAGPQQMPGPGATEVLPLVVRDLEQRSRAGRRKYGSPLRTFNGRDALVDLYQELADALMYLRQHIEEQRNFGRALRDLRVSCGISLRELASALGCRATRLGQVERGVHSLGGEVVQPENDEGQVAFNELLEAGSAMVGLLGDEVDHVASCGMPANVLETAITRWKNAVAAIDRAGR